MQYAHIGHRCVTCRAGALKMTSTLREQIQSACDDVHRDPDDAAAIDRLRELLGGQPGMSQANWRRLVKLACDELYDSPEDPDCRDRLLALLTTR